MIHDPDLLDRLSAFHPERFEGEVFRATRTKRGSGRGIHQRAGGGAPAARRQCRAFRSLHQPRTRWGARRGRLVSGGTDADSRALSNQRDAPGRLDIAHTAAREDRSRHARGSIWPVTESATTGERRRSARLWSFSASTGSSRPRPAGPCDNLMIFGDNHALAETLEPIGAETVEWREWAQVHGIPSDTRDLAAETPDGQQD